MDNFHSLAVENTVLAYTICSVTIFCKHMRKKSFFCLFYVSPSFLSLGALFWGTRRVTRGTEGGAQAVLLPPPCLSLRILCWQRREKDFCGFIPSAGLGGDEEPLELQREQGEPAGDVSLGWRKCGTGTYQFCFSLLWKSKDSQCFKREASSADPSCS